MSGTGATLFRDSSVRVRRHSVIVGKVSVDVNVAENDGSPVFIGDGSLGNAPGVPSFCSDDLTEERERRAMGNGKWEMGTRPEGACQFFAKRGEVRCPPIAQTGRCVVVVGRCGCAVLCCGGNVPRAHSCLGCCIHRQPWSGGPDGLCPPISSANARRITLTAHSGPGICRCLLRSTSTPSVSSVLSPIPANNGCSGLVC